MTDIHVEHHLGYQTLMFNRPAKRNALHDPMYDALRLALEHGEADDAIRAHVLIGHPGVFTAGNDISEFVAKDWQATAVQPVVSFLRCVAQLRKPLLAGVDGLCIGIGTTLLLHCDYVVASPRSVFRTPFVDLGLVPEAASSLLAPRLMGHARAFELLCLGASFDAPKALQAGLVNAVVAESEVLASIVNVAEALATKPPQALALARRLLRGDPAQVLARIDEEATLFAQQLSSPEARQFFQRFLGRSGAPS
ncbi:MAG: crotonase/enoyl-CoA hydratase family protein [Proteobacteria bacterium]|nr:crotonase/enoyl-CoA hydratase family protein [Pseudomonadota bacterium]